MSKNELEKIVLSKPNVLCTEKFFYKEFPSFYEEINKINFPSDFKFSQKLYHYLNDDNDLILGICPVCGKRCYFKSFGNGYCSYCSPKCRRLDINPMEKMSSRIKLSKIKKEQYSNKEWHDDVCMKQKNTCDLLYGGIGYQSQILYEKSQNTTETLYGDKKYHNIEKTKLTNNIKFGVDFPFQSSCIQNKVNETFFKKCGKIRENNFSNFNNLLFQKFGKTNISQTHYWSTVVHKKKIYNDISYDSNWEIIVAKYCDENNIEYEYQPNIIFEYEYDSKKHFYHPDFLINGQLYEVKGEHFFEGDKMINPFNRNDYNDGIQEAKHQCMIKNDIIILRKYDIFNLSEVIKIDG